MSSSTAFALSSPDIVPGERIPLRFTFNDFGCTGENLSPELRWQGAPAGTKSFAVTVFDPDAPTGSGWWHWVVFNLPANTAGIPQGAGDPEAGKLPGGVVQGRTDYGVPGWGGPCPPPGDKPHRYVFTVFALGIDHIPLDDSAPAAMVGFMINANKLAEASFTAYFGR